MIQNYVLKKKLLCSVEKYQGILVVVLLYMTPTTGGNKYLLY